MTHTEQLCAWIHSNMPDLAREIIGKHPTLFRARLNAITGAQVRSCDTIEDGAAAHLAALQDLTGEQ